MKRIHFLAMPVAALLAFGLSACSDNDDDDDRDGGGGSDASVIVDGGDADGGEVDAGGAGDAGGDSDAGEEGEFVPKPVPPGDGAQMDACYVPSAWPAVSFDKFSKYTTETGAAGESGPSYEYLAYDEFENGMAQSLWVEIYPESSQLSLAGTFDLSEEPLDYGTCEHCVVIDAAPSSSGGEKFYMPTSGTLELAEVTTSRISGTLSDAEFAEVNISQKSDGSFVTSKVEGGCATRIAGLSFSYAPPELPEHVAKCYVPETLTAKYLSDYVYGLTTSKDGYCFETMAIPGSGTGMPMVDLFVEAYEEGTGTFQLKDCGAAPDTCTTHMVLIESTMPDGTMKTYMADSGTLVLTKLTKDLMEGELHDVHFIETMGQKDITTPKPGGCGTSLKELVFSSDDATEPED